MARDLLQDTFLAALKNIDTYKGEISEKNWLYLILKNKIVDNYRKSAKALTIRIDDGNDEFFDDKGHWKDETLPKPFIHSTNQQQVSFEFYEILEKCKNKLNQLQSSLFSMKFLDDCDSDEICAELEISESNYWVLIHRIKLKTRKCLEKMFYGK